MKSEIVSNLIDVLDKLALTYDSSIGDWAGPVDSYTQDFPYDNLIKLRQLMKKYWRD